MSVNCSSQLIYHFSPPKCLKKIILKFEASTPSSPINIAVTDTENIFDRDGFLYIYIYNYYITIYMSRVCIFIIYIDKVKQM